MSSSLQICSNATISQSLNLRRLFDRDREERQRQVVRFNCRKPFAISCLNVDVKAPDGAGKIGVGRESKEVMEAEGKVMVGTYARAPLVLASGKGCKLYDVEGREYLDLTSGIAVNALGHCDPDWVKAVVDQANVLTHVSNVYYSIPQVQCGLGRTGCLWAHEAYSVFPDIMTLAKPLAGGLPIGAVLVTEKVASAINYGDHGSTFAGGSLVCNAALTVLEKISKPAFLASVSKKGLYFKEILKQRLGGNSHVKEIRGQGLIIGIELDVPASQLVDACRKLWSSCINCWLFISLLMASTPLNKIDTAHQMYRDGKYEQALGFYTQALCMAKTKAQKIALHSNRAACFLKLHDFKKAAEECTSVLELDHKHAGALMLRAQTLVTLKEYHSALFDVNRLMELNPSSEVYLNLEARLRTQLSEFHYFTCSYLSNVAIEFAFTVLESLNLLKCRPQLTIATAIIFCHRFFLRQSHAKNDRRTIATVCMFLAGKVEETPRPLKDVILVSYEIIHKKDPEAVQRIKQKEVYEQQKELILLGERVVLATLGFDLNVQHPYKPLVDAIKKFKVAQNALAQVAWNFVNDGLRTSLCLQFKPHHIAAGAIFLAAKFLKVKLPSDGEKVWWQEFDVTPRQLEEVSNQMLELYEQNRPSTNNEAEGSTVGGVSHQTTSKASSGKEEHATTNSHSQAGGITSRPGTSKSMSLADNRGGAPRTTHNQGNEHLSGEMKSASDHNADGESSDYVDQGIDTLSRHENMGEANTLRHASHGKEDQERNVVRSEISEAGELKDKHFGRNLENREGTVGQSPQDAIKKIDRDKVKAALEKRKKSRGDVSRKTDFLDEDDFIERELEAGIELAAESEKSKRDRRQAILSPWTGKGMKTRIMKTIKRMQGMENVKE
ncbi:hypothetical protein GH714_039522 [Hevea brasiliensis]|uniref:B-like cyclin n=1 Tax=Hevea brasiliensis TaxID=3981 RepID=A0A6A6MV56_HEVBR|nr:hypothetical protein GH714_039522 [Hevea brasiliensis]